MVRLEKPPAHHTAVACFHWQIGQPGISGQIIDEWFDPDEYGLFYMGEA